MPMTMTSKKNPPLTRKCVMTQKHFQKNELLRVVKTADGIKIDLKQEILGRGAYITPDASLIRKMKKKNPFARAFRMNVSTEIYDDILAIIEPGITSCKQE